MMGIVGGDSVDNDLYPMGMDQNPSSAGPVGPPPPQPPISAPRSPAMSKDNNNDLVAAAAGLRLAMDTDPNTLSAFSVLPPG